MAEFLTIAVPDGVIRVDPRVVLFEGDSALVPLLQRLVGTDYGGWERSPGEWVFANWGGAGGARLALETVEPRFATEWRNRLPAEIAAADVPEFEPVHQAAPRVVY